MRVPHRTLPRQLSHQVAVRLEEDLFKQVQADAIRNKRTLAEQVRSYISIARKRASRGVLENLIIGANIPEGEGSLTRLDAAEPERPK